MAEKVYVVTENYRNEKEGDSTETITILGIHKDRNRAINLVKENFEKSINKAQEYFEDNQLHIEPVSENGAQVCLEFEWDTFHADYSIVERTL